MTVEEMYKMRVNGATYQHIADMSGLSKQRVHEKLKSYALTLAGVRNMYFDAEEIIFKGIYEHFKNNTQETLTSFFTKVLGEFDNNRIRTMTRFIRGQNKSRLSIEEIKNICKVVGKPFEEVFKER